MTPISREPLQQQQHESKIGLGVGCALTAAAVGMFAASLMMHPATQAMTALQSTLFFGSFFPVGFVGLRLAFGNGAQLMRDKKVLQEMEPEC